MIKDIETPLATRRAEALAALRGLDPKLPTERLAALAGCGSGYARAWKQSGGAKWWSDPPPRTPVVIKEKPVPPSQWRSSARHSIVLPPSLRRAFRHWRNTTCADLPVANAMEQAVLLGLGKPHAVKRALTRHHTGFDLRSGSGLTISLSEDTWAKVEKHQFAYGISNRSEAFRELLRLGLGLPQPKVPRDFGVEADSVPRVTRILLLAAEGLGPTEISKRVGVSRQRAHFVIEQGRTGDGAIGRLASHMGAAG